MGAAKCTEIPPDLISRCVAQVHDDFEMKLMIIYIKILVIAFISWAKKGLAWFTCLALGFSKIWPANDGNWYNSTYQ